MPRGKSNAPANETKDAKFKRLGTARLNKAISAMKSLEALANKTQYEYTNEQVSTINSALTNATKRVEDAFAGRAVPAGGVTL